MVVLPRSEYEMIMAAFSAPLRARVRADASLENETARISDDDIGADMYTELMDYITLHEMTRDYDLTAAGRDLEIIAQSIFQQSSG